MKNGFFIGSLGVFLISASLAQAQAPLIPAPPTYPPNFEEPAGAAPDFFSNVFGTSTTNSGPETGRVWFTGDYLLWWAKSSPVPPLVITGPGPTVNGPVIFGPVKVKTSPGFIGLQTVTGTPTSFNLTTPNQVLLGNDMGSGAQSGARFNLGGWLDSSHTFGVEASYFFLNTNTTSFGASSGGSPALSIPYINGSTGMETAYPVAQAPTTLNTNVAINTTPATFVHLFNNAITDAYLGSVTVRSTSSLQGAETNAFWSPFNSSTLGLRLLAGARFVELDENLDMASTVTHTHSDTTTFEPALGLPTGKIAVVNNFTSQVSRVDQFGTHNTFYGGQVGAQGEYSWGGLSLMASAKVALGGMQESVDASGASTFSVTSIATPVEDIKLAGIPLTVAKAPAVTTFTNGSSPNGLFVQPGNSGRQTRDIFAVVPEGLFQVSYRFTDHVMASVGYTFLYLSTVARPGDQIDRAISPGLVALPPNNAGATRPVFQQFQSSDFWAQGINFGLHFSY